jgi:hypothetical protein
MCTFAPGQPHHDAITVFDHPKVKDCLIDEFKKKRVAKYMEKNKNVNTRITSSKTKMT